MIQLIIELLRECGIDYGFFRLMGYTTFRGLMGMATALALSVLLGHRIIVMLYRERFRDTSGEMFSLRRDATSKRGTPQAGGVMILLATDVSVALWADLTNPFVPLLLGGFLYMGFVGFIDDFQKVRFKSSLAGLSQLAKTILLMAFIVPFSILLVSPFNPVPEELRTVVQAPFYKVPLVDLGAVGFSLFAVFAIFAIVNAVNIADGMDGLLGTTSALTLGVYLIFAFVIGDSALSGQLLFAHIPDLGEVAVFAAVLMGSILGFLWFNAYPAEVFMGDTGSLAIGGVIAMTAFFVKQELLFVIVGGVFVLEIFTSLIQDKIGYRIGRRLFYRAPFHHSMTHLGIAETKVVVRLWIIGLVLALVGLLSLKVR